MKRFALMLLATVRLFRLVQRLERDLIHKRGAMFYVSVEGPSSLREQTRIARANGEPDPEPRTACSVHIWTDPHTPSTEYRGATFSDALAGALAGPQWKQ